MADLNGGKGKFWGVDENVKYADSFKGATKVAEKVKKGGTETKSDGYVVDAIDIDWGGLKLTTIDNGWNQETISSTEQNAGKGDNTEGIHSTAYLLNRISESFTQIYNQIGGDDNAGLRKKIKTLETSINQIAGSTPEQLDGIRDRIQKIEQELDNPGAASTLVTILDTLDGFDKNTKGDVKKYINDHDKAILGTASDSATTYSVYGVRKYVDTTAKENLIGASADTWPTKQTLYGVVKYSDTKNTNLKNTLIGTSTDTTINTHYGLKHILIGTSTDAATADTIWGAKNYAVEQDTEVKNILRGTSTDASTADTIWGAKNYANTTVKNSLLGATSDQWPDQKTIYSAKNYADGVKDASYNQAKIEAHNVLGHDGDLWPDQKTVYGVAKYVDTTAKENLIGASADTWPTKQTLYGVVKYSDTKNTNLKNTLIGTSTDTTINTHYGLKHILIGTSTDAATADTIWGAKNYAVKTLTGSTGDVATSETIYGVRKYTDEKIKTLSNTAFKVSRIEEGGEGILVFSTVTSYAG